MEGKRKSRGKPTPFTVRNYEQLYLIDKTLVPLQHPQKKMPMVNLSLSNVLTSKIKILKKNYNGIKKK